jgi:p-cumate 2,3-dioxygenase subunit beta
VGSLHECSLPLGGGPGRGSVLTRSEVEDFLYREAALLDAWQLDQWLALLTEDAQYRVPSNDAQGGDPASTLYLIADDIHRLRGRVTRLLDPQAHAEFPHSRTRRLITNVRIATPSPLGEGRGGGSELHVEANFCVYRFRRNERVGTYVGRYRYRLRMVGGEPKIALREAILDAEELGSLGAVSFIL